MTVNLSALAGAGAQFLDGSGNLLTGGKLYSYEAGTTTPQITYTSASGITAHSNPIVLDAAGRVPTGEIWLTAGDNYKFVLTDSNDVLIASYDNITGINGTGITTVASSVAFTGFNSQVGTLQNLADNDGSDWIGFEPNGAGAIARSAQNKMLDTVSVKDFGAVGDGVANDTDAVQNAFNYVAANGINLYIPSGIYLLNKQIAVTSSKTISVYGDGINLSVLRWLSPSTSNGGLNFTQLVAYNAPSISGLSLYTDANAAGTAISITSPEDIFSNAKLGVNISHVDITGSDTSVACWDIGIHLTFCWRPCIDFVSIKGKNELVLPFSMSTGILLTSSQVATITRFVMVHMTNGIENGTKDGIQRDEGHSFSEFEIVGVETGIDLTNTNINAGTNIGPGHINSYVCGIKLERRWQTALHDLLIYKTNLSTSNYIGISMTDCDVNTVHDNHIEGHPDATGDTFGIVVSNPNFGSGTVIHDNVFQYFTGTSRICIVIGTNANKTLVHHNSCDNTPSAIILCGGDAAKNNLFYDNLPATQQLLTVDSPTPSVGNDLCGKWYFANTTPTDIANLNDGYDTQTVIITTANSNTTIKANANFILKGNVDFAMTTYDVITLVREASFWREVSRTEF